MNEMQKLATKYHQNKLIDDKSDRATITVRVSASLKILIEDAAKKLGKNLNTLAADILDSGIKDLLSMMQNMDQELQNSSLETKPPLSIEALRVQQEAAQVKGKPMAEGHKSAPPLVGEEPSSPARSRPRAKRGRKPT